MSLSDSTAGGQACPFYARCPPGTAAITVLGRSPIVFGLAALASLLLLAWVCVGITPIVSSAKQL